MRQPRQLKKGAAYHVFSRFNRPGPYFNGEKPRQIFLNTIEEAHEKYRFRLLSFTLMETHFHMIIIPGQGENLSRIMQWILGVTAQRMNKQLGYEGHVWRGRFKSVIIDSLKQLVHTIRYIAQNPVKAGLVKKAEDWLHGSHRYMFQRHLGSLSAIFGMSVDFIEKWAPFYRWLFSWTSFG